MKQYSALVKTLLINEYGFLFKGKNKQKSFLDVDSNKNLIRKKIGVGIGGAIVAALYLFYIVYFVIAVVPIFAENQMLPQFANIIISATQFIVLFFGIYSVIPTLYFSKDNEFLQSLPMKKSAVFGAKFTIIYISELSLSTVIIVPALLVLGITSSVMGVNISAAYYVSFLFIIPLTPLLPLTIVSILSFPLMYLVSYLKNKPVISSIILLLFSLIAIVPMILFSVFSQGMFEATETGLVLSQGVISFFDIFYNVMYPNSVILNAMFLLNGIGGYFVDLIIYLAVMSAFAVFSLLLSSWLYGKALSFNLENVKGKNKNNEIKVKSAKNPVNALMMLQLKSTFKDSSFAVNIFTLPVLMPIIILVMSLSFKSDLNGAAEEVVDISFFVLGMCLYVVSMLIAIANYLALMPVSMDGKNFYFIKSLPISYSDYIKSKIFMADILSLVSVVLATIVLLCVGHQNIMNSIMFPVSLILYSLGVNRFGIYYDMRKPKLNWNNFNEFKKSGIKLWKQIREK